MKAGGSTRRNGELEERRCLEMAWMRLCLGEPRLLVMGVDFEELGEERALRIDGTAGEALRLMLGLTGEVKREKLTGFTNPASELVFDFLVGELKMDGSIFSESTSSKTSGARWRFPVDWAGDGFKGDAKLWEMAIAIELVTRLVFWTGGFLPFCRFFALWRACSRGLPISAKGWRVKVAMVEKRRINWW